MTSTDPTRRDGGSPTVAEITALTTRLRDLSARARTVDPAGRAAFLADKQALLERITDAGTDDRLPGRAREEAKGALSDVVLARAAEPGYVLVGPSSRTWLRDPVTGQPAAPVPEAEHRAVRELLGREVLDTTEPEWVTGSDGLADVHSTVVLTDNEPDEHTDDYAGDDAGADEIPARDDITHSDGDGVTDPDGHPHWADPREDTDDTGDGCGFDCVHSHRAAPERIEPAPAHEDDPAPRWDMPDWMGQHAARTEAARAAGTAPAVRPDDPGELAARVAALREQITARTADSSEHTSTAGLDDGQARREQLTRWHHDDTDTVHDTTNAAHGPDQDGDQGDDGWGWSR